jgi:hypothetical protein
VTPYAPQLCTEQSACPRVGIEREEKYCEIAVRRLAQTTLALGAP